MVDETYLEELLHERTLVDGSVTAHCLRLLDDEIKAAREGKSYSESLENGKVPEDFKEEIVELKEKTFLPINDFPHFNFVGKILGPKGQTLKGIQTATRTKILILGHGSLRDQEKEEELIQGGLPEHEHLREPIHVLIKTRAPKSEAYGNIAAALRALTRCCEDMNTSRNDPSLSIPEQPMLRYGIPPPGAIIIGQPPPFMDMEGVASERHVNVSAKRLKYNS